MMNMLIVKRVKGRLNISITLRDAMSGS